MARFKRKREPVLYEIRAEEIAATVAASTGLSVNEFRQELEQPAAFARPEICAALFGLGLLLASSPDRRAQIIAAAEAFAASGDEAGWKEAS